MNLYSKNLTSIDALKREKLRLKAESDASINSLFNTGKPAVNKDDDAGGFDVNTAIAAGMDALTSKGAMNKIMALALPALEMAELKIEKKFIMSVSKEVIGGYLKWKAVQIGLGFISSAINNRFDKRND